MRLDVTMTRKRKRTSNYLIGEFSGSLQLASGSPPSLLWTSARAMKNRNLGFFSSNSEYISSVAFLKHKIAENRELALWHLVNRLVLENA
jgi:hypothetical protein